MVFSNIKMFDYFTIFILSLIGHRNLFLIPLICHILDKKDKDKFFAVGYFVNAIKVKD